MKYVKDVKWLLEHMNNDDIRIIDCRFSLGSPEKGRLEYTKSHIPGAVYFDLEKDLSSSVRVHGGRHPLPDIVQLVSKLEAVGIEQHKTVLAYDNGEGAFASRFWWMLHYLGHEKVFVLDEGFSKWQEEGLPVTDEIPSYLESKFHYSANEDMLAVMEDIRDIVSKGNQTAILIDSREEQRYLGQVEPIDKKAGHIPGAINMPWAEGFTEGKFKTNEQQKKRFRDLDPSKEIIVYCGSGVTATPNVLALKEAGYERVKLYAGSFSDWISYEDNPID